jgi:hypothetical protein
MRRHHEQIGLMLRLRYQDRGNHAASLDIRFMLQAAEFLLLQCHPALLVRLLPDPRRALRAAGPRPVRQPVAARAPVRCCSRGAERSRVQPGSSRQSRPGRESFCTGMPSLNYLPSVIDDTRGVRFGQSLGHGHSGTLLSVGLCACPRMSPRIRRAAVSSRPPRRGSIAHSRGRGTFDAGLAARAIACMKHEHGNREAQRHRNRLPVLE